MARKILISFLGTGVYVNKESREYRTARYHLGENDLGDYTFVAAALKKHYGIHSTFLIGTAHSMWEEVYRWHRENDSLPVDDDVYFEIAEGCEKANYKSELSILHKEAVEEALGNDSKVVLIKYGITEEEVRENINIILGLERFLRRDDELIVDVTHSFRSHPLFMMNLLLYLQNVSKKRIKISHIHYGMLEISRELRYVPILELKSIMEINDWITGAYSFSQFGNAYMISKLIEPEKKNVATLLNNFSDMMNLNHLFAIRSLAQRLTSIKKEQYNTYLPGMIITPIVNNFINTFKPYAKTKDSVFQLKVARWQLSHRKYAQAFLTLSESIVSLVCEENDYNTEDFQNRDAARKALRPNSDSQLICDDEWIALYRKIRKLRNATAHAIETKTNSREMIATLEEATRKLGEILGCQDVAISSQTSRTAVFINLSNHPVEKWSPKQRDAAATYGRMMDIPFPPIPPNATSDDIRKLADKYVQEIQVINASQDVTVHIMGEMTFTFTVIEQLKNFGIRCVASTTKRNVTEQNGQKTSTFEFVQFRDY